jgi:hypothetical protein
LYILVLRSAREGMGVAIKNEENAAVMLCPLLLGARPPALLPPVAAEVATLPEEAAAAVELSPMCLLATCPLHVDSHCARHEC